MSYHQAGARLQSLSIFSSGLFHISLFLLQSVEFANGISDRDGFNVGDFAEYLDVGWHLKDYTP